MSRPASLPSCGCTFPRWWGGEGGRGRDGGHEGTTRAYLIVLPAQQQPSHFWSLIADSRAASSVTVSWNDNALQYQCGRSLRMKHEFYTRNSPNIKTT